MPEISTAVSSSVFYRKMGSGPVVILLHGFPESGTLWQNIWDDLSRSYTLIIPDFPGSGNSLLEKDTSINDMAQCVKTIMEHEGIDSVVIAGHSMGGYVAFAFADLYPDMVKGLSLVHSTPGTDAPEKTKIRLKSIELIKKGGKDIFITHMVPNLFSPTFCQLTPKVVEAQVLEALKMDGNSMINFYNAMIARHDNTHVLNATTFPLQWIIGVDDNVIHYKKILQSSYRSAINFISFYHNCGHMSMIEAPEKLISDFKLFIDYCYS